MVWPVLTALHQFTCVAFIARCMLAATDGIAAIGPVTAAALRGRYGRFDRQSRRTLAEKPVYGYEGASLFLETIFPAPRP